MCFIYSYLPVGVKNISVEIYDECALTMDELVAYGQIPILESLFRRESIDDWFQLSGKQGDNKEGSIHLILTLLVFCFLFFLYPKQNRNLISSLEF